MPRKKETPIKTSVKSGNFRATKKGAGMTSKGVKAYRAKNPGSKLKTAVTGKVKPGSASAKRRKSFCARSAGQMKKNPKAAANPPPNLNNAAPIAALPIGDLAIFLTDLVTFLTSLPRPYICLADSRSMIPPS